MINEMNDSMLLFFPSFNHIILYYMHNLRGSPKINIMHKLRGSFYAKPPYVILISRSLSSIKKGAIVEAKIPLKLYLNDKQTLVLKLRL